MTVGEGHLVPLADLNPPPTLQQQQQQQQSSNSSTARKSDRSTRQSPEGREREFPATRVGTTQLQQQLSTTAQQQEQQQQQLQQQQQQKQQHRHSLVGAATMGGGDDRYYHTSGQSSTAGNSSVRCPPGQLGQSRDFHYSVQDHHGGGNGSSSGYRTSSTTSSASGRQSGSRSDTASGYHHSPHVSTTSRSRGSRDYYLESKASPYHHSSSAGSSRSSGIRSSQGGTSAERQDPNYAILRQRHQQAAAAAAAAANAAAVAAAAAEYEHRLTHHSGSRSDLLEHDHNAVMYEHGLSSASAYGVPPQTQYTFVRMCDGKFVRTAIPLHDFDSLEGSGYYRMAASSVNHTLRRPTKRHSSAAASALAAAAAAAAGGNDSYACCPRVDDLSRSRAAPATYATLRGQKWAHRQKSGCGVGDNYGRSGGISYHDESRSVTDDFLALPRAPGDLHHLPPPSNVGLSMASSKIVKGLSGNVMLSRSTDRNLDNLGLDDDEEEDDLDDEDDDDDDLFPVRTSDEALSLLTREPPDGKEKPEPSKTSMHKMETLSRKSSKCDLIPSTGNGNGSSGNNNAEAVSCRSEATSICGETSSVLSGSTMAGIDRSKGDGKRDSLSSSVTNKDVGSSLFADGILPPPPLSLPMTQDELDVGLGVPSGGGNNDFR